MKYTLPVQLGPTQDPALRFVAAGSTEETLPEMKPDLMSYRRVTAMFVCPG